MARYSDILLYENPRRRGRRRRRNPAGALAMPRPLRRWMQGVGFIDLAAATGGLAASTLIPSMIITTTVTGWQKFSKIGVALASAIGISMLVGNISSSAGKAALLGGVAGVGAQALGMWTTIQIGNKQTSFRRKIGETTRLSPLSEGRESEITSVIEP